MKNNTFHLLVDKSKNISKRNKIIVISLLMIVLLFSILSFLNSQVIPTFALQEKVFSQTVSGTGRIIAADEVLLKAEVAARIKEIVFPVGQQAAAGEILLLFSSEEAEAQYEQALASYNTALSNYRLLREAQYPQAAENLRQQELESEAAFARLEKDEELFAAGAISRTALEESQKNSEILASRFRSAELNYLALSPRGAQNESILQQLNAAEAALKIAKERLNKHIISAPFTGEVLKYYPRPGEWVAAGSNLLSFADPGSFYVSLELDERFAALLKKGQDASIIISSTGQKIPAIVNEIGRLIEPDKGTIEIALLFTENPGELIKDLTVQVEIFLRREEKGLIIPAAMLYSRSPLKVLLINEGVLEAREISAEAINLTEFLIVDGLLPGEMIVLPDSGLLPGDKVGIKRIKEVSNL